MNYTGFRQGFATWTYKWTVLVIGASGHSAQPCGVWFKTQKAALEYGSMLGVSYAVARVYRLYEDQ